MPLLNGADFLVEACAEQILRSRRMERMKAENVRRHAIGCRTSMLVVKRDIVLVKSRGPLCRL
jgi:hypothetical protein